MRLAFAFVLLISSFSASFAQSSIENWKPAVGSKYRYERTTDDYATGSTRDTVILEILSNTEGWDGKTGIVHTHSSDAKEQYWWYHDSTVESYYPSYIESTFNRQQGWNTSSSLYDFSNSTIDTLNLAGKRLEESTMSFSYVTNDGLFPGNFREFNGINSYAPAAGFFTYHFQKFRGAESGKELPSKQEIWRLLSYSLTTGSVLAITSELRFNYDPANGVISIETSDKEEFRIVDILGRTVLQLPLHSGVNVVAVSHVAMGEYFAILRGNVNRTWRFIR